MRNPQLQAVTDPINLFWQHEIGFEGYPKFYIRVLTMILITLHVEKMYVSTFG